MSRADSYSDEDEDSEEENEHPEYPAYNYGANPVAVNPQHIGWTFSPQQWG
jgi:hypothetical protein